MQISNAKYVKLTPTNENIGIAATIDGEDVTVPIDPDNRHYDEIQRQVAAGTLTIQEAD